jgi:zinc D-Ala-D-Ala carboxypeptidase
MLSPWKYFSLDELKCHCGKCKSTGAEMSQPFMERIIKVRELFGPISPNSAYRCPAHNNAVSHTGLNGPHTTGKAMDIPCSGEGMYRLHEIVTNMKFPGIGIARTYIHVDDCSYAIDKIVRPRIWIYP